MAELIFDDSTYFRFIYISFQKDGIITDPDEITIFEVEIEGNGRNTAERLSDLLDGRL